MLKIEGRTFMNIQEAVQWLLDNNALPFQSSANYQANTEIGLGTIVNPSPAKVRIGSLIFFADSKVSTVVGITDTGFICSDKYNNLVDDIAYVTNVAINASGHLITTLSDGQTIDAGIVKQVSSFSINASQHLIATYNDGTTTDLGAIFSGNITISGDLTVTGALDATIQLEKIKDSAGHNRFVEGNAYVNTISGVTVPYCRWSLSGTHLLLVYSANVADGTTIGSNQALCEFGLPEWIRDKIVAVFASNAIEVKSVELRGNDWSQEADKLNVAILKSVSGIVFSNTSARTMTKDRSFRIQADLLIDNQ